jgi:hypothetical protein
MKTGCKIHLSLKTISESLRQVKNIMLRFKNRMSIASLLLAFTVYGLDCATASNIPQTKKLFELVQKLAALPSFSAKTVTPLVGGKFVLSTYAPSEDYEEFQNDLRGNASSVFSSLEFQCPKRRPALSQRLEGGFNTSLPISGSDLIAVFGAPTEQQGPPKPPPLGPGQGPIVDDEGVFKTITYVYKRKWGKLYFEVKNLGDGPVSVCIIDRTRAGN